MKRKISPFYLLVTIGLLFSALTACNKTEDDQSTGKVKDADGNVYKTVTIGNQVWMAENLKTTKYNNGDPINNVTDGDKWADLKTGAWCNYDNDVTTGNKFGKLYNSYAVKTGNLAPKGWHVPTYAEWIQLSLYVTANPGTSGSAEKSLAATTDWNSCYIEGAIGNDLTKNNFYGFSALPGGAIDGGKGFDYINDIGFWWSSDGSKISLSFDNEDNYLFEDGPGLSVRCVKDYTHDLPTVETSAISEIKLFTATCGGNVTGNGGEEITTRGVCWSTSSNPTVNDSITTRGTGIGVFTCNLSGLKNGTTYYVKAYATNSIGTVYGSEVSFTTIKVPDEVSDIDGNIYHTIIIGTQVWLRENLNTTKYRNGDPIPNVTDDIEWSEMNFQDEGAYCDYNNNPDKGAIYGKLYNWRAVSDLRKIAPTGCHIPSSGEWLILIKYLIANGYNFDGTKYENKIAKSLASTTGWDIINTNGSIGSFPESNNKSGFTAFPGGYRDPYTGKFSNIGNQASWWSSDRNENFYVTYPYLNYWDYSSNTKYADVYYSTIGLSIRCLWDY